MMQEKKEITTDVRYEAQSATEIVVRGIKEAIRKGNLKAGERLPNENELCELFGVGRSSLREGLKILSAQGLVEMRHGIGTFMSDGENHAVYDTLFYHLLLASPDKENVEELRRIIEIDILEQVLKNYNRNEKERLLLKENVQELKSIAAESHYDKERLLKNDMAFHKLLAKASKNQVLRNIYQSLIDYIHLSIAVSHRRQSAMRVLDSHQRIYDLIEKRDTYSIANVVSYSLQPWEASDN